MYRRVCAQGHRGARGSGGVVGTDAEKERIARRFFAAMVLNDLIQEVSGGYVCVRGRVARDMEGLCDVIGTCFGTDTCMLVLMLVGF